MTAVARRNPWAMLRLGNLLTTTVVVIGAIICWLVFADGDATYTPLLSGAVTTLTVFWALFGFQKLRRRQPV